MKLHLPSTLDLLATRKLKPLKLETPWKRHAPALMVNLSGTEIQNDVSTSLTHQVHATYAGCYSKQMLYGFHHLHALIDQDGQFNCQELNHYAERLNRHIAHPPPDRYKIPRIQRTGDGYVARMSDLDEENTISLPEPSLFGSPIEPANWGMWLLQALPSAAAFVAEGQHGAFLCYAPEQWQQELLSWMGVRPDRLVQQCPWTVYRLPEVRLFQYSTIDLVVDDLTRSVLDAVANRCEFGTPRLRSRKLFVSRRSITTKLGGVYRALLNERELIEKLKSRGYEVIEPEDLTLPEQVARFGEASAVVGLGGAGMFNTAFCAPRTKVISVEGTDAFLLNHARFFASVELEYGFIVGAEDRSAGNHPHNPWTLDIERALKAIDSFI